MVQNPDGRASFVFAMRPSLKGKINLGQFGREGTVNTKDYYFEIKSHKYNVNAKQDLREEQKLERKEWMRKSEKSEADVSPRG